MSSWVRVLFLGALAAALALPWLVSWRSRAALQQEVQQLQQQVKGLPRLQAEHERLSNLVAQATPAPPAPQTEAQELVKLRHAVGLLRRQTNELAHLAAENFRASQALLDLARAPVGKAYARQIWAYAGYERPEDAVQSLLWATRNRDLEQMFSSGTPEFRAYHEKALKTSKQDFEDGLNEMATQVTEYRVTDASALAEDLVVLYVWFEYSEQLKEQKGEPGYGVPLYVKKVDGQWKLHEP